MTPRILVQGNSPSFLQTWEDEFDMRHRFPTSPLGHKLRKKGRAMSWIMGLLHIGLGSLGQLTAVS